MRRGARPLQLFAARSHRARYAFAVVVAVGSLLAKLLLMGAADVSVYSILVGAVALTVWYGGVGPGLACTAIGWAGAIVPVVSDGGSVYPTERGAWLQWAISLAVALGMIWISYLLRRGRRVATEHAVAAEESVESLETLQGLSSALSAAASVSDVVTVLVDGASAVVGAPAALAFVEEDNVVFAERPDPTLAPWQEGEMTETRMLHRTATEGRLLRATGRAEFEAMFPGTAALAPDAEGAIAVPLRVEGRVIGSLGFLFARPEDVHEKAETLALVAGGLGAQALERARLYQRAQESRRGLDRILRIAPSFFTGTEQMVNEAICREARTLFGAHLATLWHLDGDQMELNACDPKLEPLETGLVASLEDFPWLRNAVRDLEISFVADVREEARAAGLERVERLDLRSSLRVPVVNAGRAELILIVSWQTILSEPDPSTLILIRRFADQAGLALEQLARRQAQADADRRTAEVRRLQTMTVALSNAATPQEVGAVCLEHALAAVGADGGFVVRSPVADAAFELVASNGLSADALAVWSGHALDMDVPVARAMTVGAPVWALTPEEMGTFVAARGFDDAGWIAMPLRTSSRVHGALQLTFRTEREVSEEARERLGTIVSGCALAFERSLLFESEQRLRRRSERLQEMTAELSNALTRSDVANVLLAAVEEAVGGDGMALALLGDGPELTELLGWRGYDEEVAARWLAVSLHGATPQGQALRSLSPQVHDTFPNEPEPGRDGSVDAAATGHASFLFVPLVLGRRPIALLVASSREPYDLHADELRFVGSLAGQAAQALDRARRFETEQTIAETLQRSVLPSSLPLVDGVQVAGRYLPGTADLDVGGDWFDAIAFPNGRLGLVVGDVVGKGVRAAATMGQLRNAIRAFSLERLKPSTTLARLSRLTDEVIETSFATVVYAELVPETGICRYASAGHPPPLVAYLDGRAEFLEGGRGVPLGTAVASRYRQDVVELPAGSVLLCYTDGLIERRGRSLDEGLELLRAAVRDGPRDPDLLVDHVLDRLVGDGERRDDVVVLAARLLPVAPRPLDLRLGGGEASLRHAREALRLWLEGAPVSPMDAHDIVLAAWEACANANEHAGAPEAGYRLRADLDEDAVRIVVEDAGRWSPPAEQSTRGLGLRLMASLMSSVDVEPGAHGTRVMLVKALAPVAEQPLTEAR